MFKSHGDAGAGAGATTRFLDANKDALAGRAKSGIYWKRVLKRIDLTSRSLVALIEPGSCFAGTLAELAVRRDRSYMLIGAARGRQPPPAAIALTALPISAPIRCRTA